MLVMATKIGEEKNLRNCKSQVLFICFMIFLQYFGSNCGLSNVGRIKELKINTIKIQLNWIVTCALAFEKNIW